MRIETEPSYRTVIEPDHFHRRIFSNAGGFAD
jgi:hypothetical protein